MPTKYVKFFVEVYARVDCEMEMSDFGVPGSPTFVEPDPSSFKISNISILDVDLDKKNIPARLLVFLEEEAIEASYNDGEWE